MWTPSGSTSPEATYSIAWVEQPHSGWIRNSASGCSARVARCRRGGSRRGRGTRRPRRGSARRARGRRAARSRARRTSPATCRGRRGSRSLPRARARCADDLHRVGGGAAVVRLGLHLGGGVDVHHHDGAGVLRLPGAQLVGGDRVGKRAAGLGVRDQHRLLGREDRGGLGHEVNAAEGDDVGVGGRRLARECSESPMRSATSWSSGSW